MSSIYTPSAIINVDANGNVLANIAAQNINPNINNPYGLTLVSHQTGLSITATVANTAYAIGAAITIPRNGLMSIGLIGHINGGNGMIDFTITRGATTYYFYSGSSTAIGGTFSNVGLFGNTSNSSTSINNTSPNILFMNGFTASTDFNTFIDNKFLVLDGDVIQFRAANGTAANITYIDDLVVVLQ